MSKERPRGILSEADRNFLYGQSDIDQDSKGEVRRRIRERIKNGFLDFDEFLNSHIERYARYKDPKKPLKLEPEEEFRDAFVSVIEYVYRLCLRSPFDFESILKDAIRRVDPIAEVTFDIDQQYELENAKQKWNDGRKKELTEEEITLLLISRCGKLNEQEITELIELSDKKSDAIEP